MPVRLKSFGIIIRGKVSHPIPLHVMSESAFKAVFFFFWGGLVLAS